LTTTCKAQLLKAVKARGDSVDGLICFYQEPHGYDEPGPSIRCSFNELPERKFDDGYGGTNGEPCIAFSDRYVYINVQYDGAEWMEAIPRHPDFVDDIPWPGGS